MEKIMSQYLPVMHIEITCTVSFTVSFMTNDISYEQFKRQLTTFLTTTHHDCCLSELSEHSYLLT